MNQAEFQERQRRVQRDLKRIKFGEDNAAKVFNYYRNLPAYREAPLLLEAQIRKIFQEGVHLGREIERERHTPRKIYL